MPEITIVRTQTVLPCGCQSRTVWTDGRLVSQGGETCPECLGAVSNRDDNPRNAQLDIFQSWEGLTNADRKG